MRLQMAEVPAPAATPPRRVLVVEDEPLIRQLVEQAFRQHGFAIDAVGSATEGLEAFRRAEPDLVLLDVMLPDVDGVTLCRQIRAESAVPIVMLTALASEADVVGGLQAGADDYVVKPFRPSELLARAEAHLRRRALERQPAAPSRVVLDEGRFVVDLAARSVRVGEREVLLTPREFSILSYLAQHAGRVVPHPELIGHVWGSNDPPRLVELRTYVKLIRRKIEPDPAHPRYLRARAGAGYTVPRL